MIACSPGILQGCFELLEIVSRNSIAFAQIQHSFSRLGSMPAARVIEAAQCLQWLQATSDGITVITPSGERIRSLSGYQAMLRQAILDYVEIERPAWLQNAIFGRARVLSFASSDVAQVFVEAALATGADDDVVEFWDLIAARARGLRSEHLNAIGREGERLTMSYEAARTGRQPKWIAVENNADGYDILSVVEPGDLRHLSIEVKATTAGLAGRFHITRNEWEWAAESELHAFHLWDIRSKATATLAVLKTADVVKHIPSNCGKGNWESVEIPFRAFQTHFELRSLSV